MIPSHWDETYLSRAYSLKSITEHTDEDLLSVFLDRGVINYNESDKKQVHKPSEDMSKYQLVEPGDFVMNNQQAWRGSVGVSNYRGIISPAYYIWTPRNDYNPKYMNYMLRDKDIIDQFVLASKGVGSIQRQIYVPYLKTTVLAIPPREEQDQIVRYLDWQISKINKLIHGYQREIKLLEERRQSIIDLATTQGVDNVELKNSGTHWVRQIPVHWEMVYSKKLFAERKDKAFPGDEQLTASQKYGIISQREFMEREGRRVTVVMTGDDILKHVGKGDFVISMRSFQGGLEYSYVEGKISSAYVMLVPREGKVYDEYFKWLLKSRQYIKALQGTADLVRDGQALRYANFAKVPLPVVPLDEQKRIAEYIESETLKIDNAIPRIHKEIDLLREYRSRLISDVVTGQIDVRGIAIPEYEPENDTDELEAVEDKEAEV